MGWKDDLKWLRKTLASVGSERQFSVVLVPQGTPPVRPAEAGPEDTVIFLVCPSPTERAAVWRAKAEETESGNLRTMFLAKAAELEREEGEYGENS